MKIGVIVDNELNNDKRVLRELSILKEAGHEITVLCFGFRENYPDPLPGINVRRIRLSRKLKDILFFFLNLVPAYEWIWTANIKKLILDTDSEALHVHDLYMAGAGRKGIKKSGKKVKMILDLHENYPYAVTTYNWTKGFLRNSLSRPGAWQKKEERYLLYAETIIVLSSEFRETLTERYPLLKTRNFVVFPNVPELRSKEYQSDVKPKVTFDKNLFVVFYFGVVAERRGIFDLLEVFSNLAFSERPCALLIIGPADKMDRKIFYEKINSAQFRNTVKYLPWIDVSELPAYLEISDACVAPFRKNPQHESGVANKIFDYMLGRKAVIASDCRPQKNLIEKYECGIIYRNNKELEDAIIKLSENPVLCRRMGENGYNAIIKDYNIERVSPGILEIYTNITK